MKFAEDNSLQLLREPFRIPQLIEAIEDAIASGEFGQRDASGAVKDCSSHGR